MHALHFYHGHRLHQRFSDFWLYELSLWFHTLSNSLVSIFIPILLLKSGYSLSVVVGFYILFNVIDVPMNFVARFLIRQIGARLVLVLGTLAAIGFFWIFLHAEGADMYTLLFLACSAAAYDTLYWVSHFFLFMQTGKNAKYAGSSTGAMYAVRQLALMVGPLLGAALLIFSTKEILLYATIAGFVLSLLPLLGFSNLPDKPHTKSLSFREFFAPAKGRSAYLSTMFYAVHDTAESILFPLFIFVTLGTLESVAVIPVILSITTIMASIVLGRLQPKRRHLALVLGGLIIAAMWLTRIFVGDPTIYYATVLAIGVCVFFVIVPLDTEIFEHGHRVRDPLSASTYRNVTYMATNIVLYGTLAFFLNIFEPTFALATTSLLGLVFLNLLPALFMRRAHS